MSDVPKKIIAKEWRNGETTIGIVAIKQEHNEKWRAYIGCVPGVDEEVDAQYVADWGAKLNKAEAIAFFPHLDSDKFDEEKQKVEKIKSKK